MASSQRVQPSWGSARSVDEYDRDSFVQIGEGTYGQVFKGRNRSTGEVVALKKIRMDNEKEGFPITAIREIKILTSLAHKNMVKLKEIVVSRGHAADPTKGSIYMVFEYMDHDLTGLAERPGVRFSEAQIKLYMRQLLSGLAYCHANNILHRDIKGSNILINNDGVVKIADFGLARSAVNAGQENGAPLTNRVITLWYRPPELLLGATKYGPEVDMWSVGCIFAELVTGKPLLPGKNEMEQVDQIFKMCGSPNEEVWPDSSKLPLYHIFKPERPYRRRLLEHLTRMGSAEGSRIALRADVQDLCDKLLTLSPKSRITAKLAYEHDYFFNEPKASNLGELPSYEHSHEFETKKKRQEARARADAEAAAKRAHIVDQQLQAAGAGGAHGRQYGMHPYAAPPSGFVHHPPATFAPGAGGPRRGPPPPQPPPRGQPPPPPLPPRTAVPSGAADAAKLAAQRAMGGGQRPFPGGGQ